MRNLYSCSRYLLSAITALFLTITSIAQVPTLVKDINAGTLNSSVANMKVFNGALYFTATTAASGNELWKTDGTAAGTVMVAEINAGSASSNPAELTEYNGFLYFRATTSTHGTELWRTNGTAAGTTRLTDIYANANSSTPAYLTVFNGNLYFRATNGASAHGIELWRYNGTTATRITDLYTGGTSSGIAYLTVYNNALYFYGRNNTSGYEVFRYTGSGAPTLVKDIYSGTGSSAPAYFTICNGKLYFRARNSTNGYELWITDGTSAGTVMVKDIYSGSSSSSPVELFVYNNILYFRAATSSGAELWKSDGTNAGTVIVKDIYSGSSSSTPTGFTILNNTLYFRANNGSNGAELWKSDGTIAGTVIVKDINSGVSSSNPAYLVNIDNTLYFSATTSSNGNELWKSDGSAAGTVLLADINTGTGSSSPLYLTSFNYGLFFAATTATTGSELFRLQLTTPPVAFNVTGGGNYCEGSTAPVVGLSNSELNVSYQLKRNGSNVGSPVAGTGSAISFGNQATAGTYTVVGSNAVFSVTMTGSAVVSVSAVPATHISTSHAYVGTSGVVAFSSAGTYRLQLPNVPTRATTNAILKIYYRGNHTTNVVQNSYWTYCGYYVCGGYSHCSSWYGCHDHYYYCANYCYTTYPTYYYGKSRFYNESSGLLYTWQNNSSTCSNGVETIVIPKSEMQSLIADGIFSIDHKVDYGAGNCGNNSVYFTLEYEYGPDICLSAAPVAITPTPAGGTLSGPGISGNTFYPNQAGLGLHQITYTYTNAGGCTGTTTIPMNVISSFTYHPDADGDGYGNSDPEVSIQSCTPVTGYVLNSTDCDDDNAAINPGATEICNGIDDDCNGIIDDGEQGTIFYQDNDGDTYGTDVTIVACSMPEGYTTRNGDCNDNSATTYPGAPELCNGIDDNCDGRIDEGLNQTRYFQDTDNDGYGSDAATILTCEAPDGYVTVGGDCNDNNPNIHPGATEICNGIDDDCDEQIDEDLPLITYYQDNDDDGYGSSVTTTACSLPDGYVTVGGDCNDNNPEINPGAIEICGNSIDDNCDGTTDEPTTYYQDNDGDGYGSSVSITTCTPPEEGYSVESGDCNDNNPEVNPGMEEVCNGIDDDCNGQIDEGVKTTFYRDADGDTYGNPALTITACTAPAGYVENDDDCDDTRSSVHPGATEVCNGIDDDCDGQIDEGVKTTFYRDADGDTYGNASITISACSAPAGYVANDDDCDDTRSAVHPGATEICNGMDDDCDGFTDEGFINTQITCPQSGTVTRYVTGCTYTIQGNEFNATASENCGGLTYTLSGANSGTGSTLAGIVLLPGQTTITWSALNANEDVFTCSFVVDVKDNQLPSINCPSNITATATSAAGAVVNYTTPVGTDNCTGVTTERIAGLASGNTFPIGTTVVTYRATDAAGNIKDCSFNVTISGLAPSIQCPANIIVNSVAGSCSAEVNFAATETAGIPASVITYSHQPGSSFPVGVTTVTATATNTVGSSSCTFTVTVIDNQNPTIIAPANVTVNADNGSCYATNVALGSPTTDDNCGIANVSNNHVSSTYPVGVTTVTWTVVDVNGNSTTTTQAVTVIDNQNPTITAPANVTVNADNGSCSATNVVLGSTTTNDNCGVANISNNHPSSIYPVGVTTVTWTVVDVNGNSATTTQTVTVIDNQNPTIIAPANVTENADIESCSATNVALGSPTTDDNCGVATVSNNHPSSTYPVGVTTVTWTVVDVNGNSATTTQTVTVIDNQNPTIIASANVTVNADNGSCSATNVALGSPTTGDNCGVANISNNHPSSTYPVGVTTVTWTVVDVNGNSTTTIQTVTVIDNQNPTIIAPVNVTVNADNGSCSATNVALGSPTTGDNCGVASVSNNHPSSTYPVGVTTVTWTVVDVNGNSTTTTQTVTVIDNQNPTITAPANVTVNTSNDGSGNCTTTANLGMPTTGDNCTVASVIAKVGGSIINPATYLFYKGTTTVTWVVADNAGNTSEATQNVTVIDNENPTISCPSNITVNYNPVVCGAVVTYTITPGDNCPGVTTSLTGGLESGSVFPLGTTTVSWKATDASGNIATCSFAVTVTPLPVNATVTVSPNPQQYSDVVTFTATIPNGAATACTGTVAAADSVIFKVNTQVMGKVKLVGNGANLVGVLNVPLLDNPEAGTIMDPNVNTKSVTASFTSPTAPFNINNNSNMATASPELMITKENTGELFYNGAEYFSTSSPTSTNGSLTMSGYIKDSADGARGDIRKATVTFTDGSGGSTLGSNNNAVGLINQSITYEGVSATSFNYSLTTSDINNGGKLFNVFLNAGNYYTGATTFPTVVTLGLPGQDFVTGGGNLAVTNSAGCYAGTPGSKMNFGFTMKWNKSGKNLQGQINIIFRKLVNGSWRTYQIKSNAVNSMSVVSAGGYNKAIIVTKANMSDITNPLAPVALGGNLDLTLEAWDYSTSNGGSLDKIAVTLYGAVIDPNISCPGSNNLLFSSYWGGSSTAIQTLTGGNINVRSGGSSGSITSLNVKQVEEKEFFASLDVKAFPNPSHSRFNLRIESNVTNEKITLRILDINGRLKQEFKDLKAGQVVQTKEDYANGIYIAELSQGDRKTTVKLIKQPE